MHNFFSTVEYEEHEATVQNTKRVLDIALRVFDCAGAPYKIVPVKGNVVHSSTEEDNSFLLETFSNYFTL